MAERLYNVVIEQPRSPTPGAAAALAAAISARYGIPAADLERRISRGRFRVKSKVDRTTADTYATDLTRLGAVCVVQPADEGPVDVPSQTQPAVRRETGPPPGTETAWPRLAPETLPPISPPAPATDPRRPRFSPDTLQPATDPGRPATDPGRARVPAAMGHAATEPARPRMSAEAVRPSTEPGRPRIPAEPAWPSTEPGRARIPAEPAWPSTEPGRPRMSAEPARPATDPARPRVSAEAVRPAPEAPRPAPPLAAAPPPHAVPAPQHAPAGSGQPQDLGALSGGFPLTLSTLDGVSPDGGAAARPNQSTSLPASFGPASNLPASFGPPSAPEPAPPSPSPSPSPASSGPWSPRTEPAPSAPSAAHGPAVAAPEPIVDRFAPPPAAAVDVALDTDDRRRRETPGSAAATAGRVQEVPWPAATLPPRISETRPGATMAAGLSAGTTARPASGLRDPRVRLVLGAALAVGVGFVPAHFVGAMREKSAFAEIDADLAHRQTMLHSREDYAAFEAVRAAHADRKRAARQNIALGSLALWALVGGGVAWLWFRRIDWDHLLGPTR